MDVVHLFTHERRERPPLGGEARGVDDSQRAIARLREDLR